MSQLTLTIIIATIAVVICAIFIGIGRLLTGKNKFSCRRCGKPEDKKDCSLCKNKKKCHKKNQPD